MAKIIAITGTHGTGKTTLSFQLAAEYKKLGANVKIIQEVARSCPFPLNADMTRETALWIYHEHSKKELEACRDHDVVICDRTIFDSFVYAQVMAINGLYWDRLIAKQKLENYFEIYFVMPSNYAIINDGIRSIDEEFRLDIHKRLYKEISDGRSLLTIEQDQIFDKDTQWNISYP